MSSPAWPWQSVYCAGSSSVPVGVVRMRYSADPAMQSLSQGQERTYLDPYSSSNGTHCSEPCMWQSVTAVMSGGSDAVADGAGVMASDGDWACTMETAASHVRTAGWARRSMMMLIKG